MAGKRKPEILDLDDPLRDADEALQESGIVPVPTVKPPAISAPMRDRQMTLVDDDVTEQARLASVLIDSMPPRPVDPNSAQAIRARLAPLERVPELAKTIAELGDDLKEPKTAFVLGFIDGVLPLETIIEVTGLPEIETLRILDRLIAQSAIVFPRRR
jgi:hypothetical protein